MKVAYLLFFLGCLGLGIWALKPMSISPREALSISDNGSNNWVWINPNAYITGADKEPIILINQAYSANVSWKQLSEFLWKDETDKMSYVNDLFTCADYSEKLHNNAEKSGIRTAFVWMDLEGSVNGHTCNAFQTTDRGLVYIDDTRHLGKGPNNADKIVDLKVGKDYLPQHIFPENGWGLEANNMGKILNIGLSQW